MNKKPARLALILCVALIILAGGGYLVLRGHQGEKQAAQKIGPSELSRVKKPLEVKGTQKALPSTRHQEEARDAAQLPASTSQSQEPEWLAAARAALKDANVRTRRLAVLSLRKHPSPEAIDLLLQFLEDKEALVLKEAVETLGVIGFESEDEALRQRIYGILLERAQKKEFVARGRSLVLAASIGGDEPIFPVISEFIEDEKGGGAYWAVAALDRIATPDCIPYIQSILEKEKDPELRRASLNALRRIGTPEAIDLLQEKVLSADAGDQIGGTWALALQKDQDSVGVLVKAMEEHKLSGDAMSVVATSPAAPEVFGELLQNEDIGKEDKLAWLGTISNYTYAASGEIRKGMVSAIQPLLDSPDKDIQLAAVKAIGKVSGEEETAELLAPKLKSDDIMLKGAALEAFATYCTPRTYKPLLDLYWDKDKKIRRTAFILSSPFVNKSDLSTLEKATTHPDKFISEQAKVLVKRLEIGEKLS